MCEQGKSGKKRTMRERREMFLAKCGLEKQVKGLGLRATCCWVLVRKGAFQGGEMMGRLVGRKR